LKDKLEDASCKSSLINICQSWAFGETTLEKRRGPASPIRQLPSLRRPEFLLPIRVFFPAVWFIHAINFFRPLSSPCCLPSHLPLLVSSNVRPHLTISNPGLLPLLDFSSNTESICISHLAPTSGTRHLRNRTSEHGREPKTRQTHDFTAAIAAFYIAMLAAAVPAPGSCAASLSPRHNRPALSTVFRV
jgi:hypothetical protein